MSGGVIASSRRPLVASYTEVIVPLTGSGSVALPANYAPEFGCRYELIGASSGSRGGTGQGGGGVGGGAAVWGTDYTPNPGDSVPYAMGVAGTGTAYNTATGLTAGTDSWWNSTSIAKAAASSISPGNPSVGPPGLAVNSVGDNKLDGGAATAGNTGGAGRGGTGGAAASTPNIAGGVGGTPGNGTVAGWNGSTAGGGRGGDPGGGPGGGRALTNGAGAPGQPGRGRVAYTTVTWS